MSPSPPPFILWYTSLFMKIWICIALDPFVFNSVCKSVCKAPEADICVDDFVALTQASQITNYTHPGLHASQILFYWNTLCFQGVWKGPLVASELVASAAAVAVWFLAYTARNKLQSSWETWNHREFVKLKTSVRFIKLSDFQHSAHMFYLFVQS